MSYENRCVCCGHLIPEGRQVCRTCEQKSCQHVWLFDRLEVVGRKRLIHMRCQVCGARRADKPVNRSDLWPEDRAEDEG